MREPLSNEFDEISISGLIDSDLISALNQNKLSINTGAQKLTILNPEGKNYWEVRESEIHFLNEEIIYFILGRLIFEKYRSSPNFISVFEKLRQINDINKFLRAEKYFFYACNLNDFPWLQIFASSDKEGYYFFQVFSAFSDTVEYKSIDPKTIIQVITDNYEVLKKDGAYNSLLNAIKMRATLDLAWAHSFFDIASHGEINLAYDILPNLFRGISSTEGNLKLLPFVRTKIESAELTDVKLGIMCFGFMSYSIPADVKWMEETITILNGDKYNNEEIQTLSVIAITNLVELSKVCQNVIEKFAQSASLSIKPAVAFCLFKHSETNFDSTWFANSLISLAKQADTEPSITQWLQTALNSVSRKRKELFIDFFEEAILSENFQLNFAEIYKHQFTYYYNNNRPAFSLFISEWFNRDHPIYQLFLERILREFFIMNYHKIELDVDYCNNLSDEDVIFITHKIIGFTSHSQSQTYLLLSCIQKTDRSKEVFDFVHEVFRDHICYNYPSTNDLLESIIGNYPKHIQDLMTAIVKESRDYFKKRSTLTPIKELGSSEVRAKLFASIRNKQMQEAFENAQSGRSFLTSMVHQIGLKGGEFWFSKHKGVYQKKSRLNTIEHGGEMPRGEYIDPLGQSLMRRRFRLYKRRK